MVGVLKEREIGNLGVRELVFFSFLSERYKKKEEGIRGFDWTLRDK